MDFVNWEFAKDFIGNSLRISLGIFWTKFGLVFRLVKIYNEYNNARIVDKEMKYLLFLCLKIERRIFINKDDVMLWHGKRCESNPYSDDEINELEELLKEFK